jgi:hypothetical protein
MPYFITDSSADCSGWAVVKDDGEVMGCHQTKADAVDQMVAISLEEGIEPGGERSVRALPDNYRPAVSEDVPEGRACGNCVHYDEDMVNDDGVQVWCDLWADWVRGDYYCNRWEGSARYGKDDDEDERSADMGNKESDVIMEDEEFRFEAPRENLVRKVEFRAEPSPDGLTL